MKITLAQVNPIIGDLEGNVALCLDAFKAARLAGADLVVLPELALTGCPPLDILLDPSFVSAAAEAAADLAQSARSGPPLVVGSVAESGVKIPHHPGLYNAVLLLKEGDVFLAAAKRLLRADDIYHEPRWFSPGAMLPPMEICGRRVGFLLGSDLQDEGCPAHPASDLIAAGIDLLVCLDAAPYSRGVGLGRLQDARKAGSALVYANLCGGNDELIFEGRSFVLNDQGQLIAALAPFAGQTLAVDLESPPIADPPILTAEEEIYRALVLGVRDFMDKNRLERAFLGVSGGVDSAVVACLAAAALGPERVTAVAIPSRHTDPRSTSSARELAEALGIEFQVVEMEGLHQAAEMVLGDLLNAGTGAENIQARLRAMILLAFTNRHGGILLNTSNKTELSLGYGTAHGDLAGTLSPIGDLTKPEVILLAHWINQIHPVIPRFILERPPSAELKPGQVDPFDYEVISPMIERLVQENRSNEALRRSENKRKQLGVVLRVSEKAFGMGRLIPITRR